MGWGPHTFISPQILIKVPDWFHPTILYTQRMPWAFLPSFVAQAWVVRFHVCWLSCLVRDEGMISKSCRSRRCDLTLAPDLHPMGVKLNSGMPRLTWQLLPGGERARQSSPLILARSGFTSLVPFPIQACARIPVAPNSAEAPEEEPPQPEDETIVW